MEMFVCQVDAMKVSVKEFKKEYKKINIDQIEVRTMTISYINLYSLWTSWCLSLF
jgi:hypothetical protein